MKKIVLFGALLLSSIFTNAQFSSDDIIYYVGEGPDTAVLVIDFLDETVDSSYVWGYLFDATTSKTGGDMLAEISLDEEFLTVALTGGFLADITFNDHEGLMGLPNYWGTWSKTEETEWISNMGIGTVLAANDWFGCSYTDFDPAVAPGEPIPAYASKMFNSNDVQFWVGTGDDSAVFVVDFVSDVYGEAVTFAWGYAFDGTTDGETMLADIAAADFNLTINATAFLNDILYNSLEGIGGDPNYWGTWSGTNLSDWTMNAGLSTEINDGDWFGCSYDAWPPRRPFYPIAAISSHALTFTDVDFLIGEGENLVAIVFDFNGAEAGESYVFGYQFTEITITASEVITAIVESGYYDLSVDMTGGFLNDVEFDGQAGIGGDPYYWATWSGENVGGFSMNTGISEVMENGDWFAATYTNWAPATPPSTPVNAISFVSVTDIAGYEMNIYPNPTATNNFNIEVESNSTLKILALNGALIQSEILTEGKNTISIDNLAKGMYLLSVETAKGTAIEQLIVQ